MQKRKTSDKEGRARKEHKGRTGSHEAAADTSERAISEGTATERKAAKNDKPTGEEHRRKLTGNKDNTEKDDITADEEENRKEK